MKLSCQTCQAKYTLADDKVRGKIVRIRCKKCRSIVIANGVPLEDEGGQVWAAPAAPTAPPAEPIASRTGERNEQSVLFSLSALTEARARAPEPVVGPTNGNSGLLDIRMLSRATPSPQPRPDPGDEIMHLGFGGMLAPPLGGPGGGHEAAATDAAPTLHARAEGVRRVLFGALGVGITLLILLSVALVKRTSPSSVPERPAALAASPTPAEPSARVASVPKDPEPDAPPVASTPVAPAVRVPVIVSALPRPPASASARPPEGPARCCPGETETACEMRRSVGAACGQREAMAAFDSGGAARALASIDLRVCGKAGGPTGAGHARVTFQASGAVSDVIVDTPEFSGTTTERCVAQAYRRAKVAAFSGPALTVGKRFIVSGES